MAHGLHHFIREQGLKPIGKGHFFQDRNGNTVLIRETQRRSDFRGEDFGGDDTDSGYQPDYMGGRMAEVSVYRPAYIGEGEYVGEFGNNGEDDDFGRRGGGGRGGHRHGHHRGPRMIETTPSQAEIEERQETTHVNIAGAVPKGWCTTVVSDLNTYLGAGNSQVQIRLQHDLLGQDLNFDGTVAGAKVTTVTFGDRLIFNNTKGVAVSLFAASGFIRNFLGGQRLRAGLDITVSGTVPGAGDFVVNVVGAKPYAVALGT